MGIRRELGEARDFALMLMACLAPFLAIVVVGLGFATIVMAAVELLEWIFGY